MSKINHENAKGRKHEILNIFFVFFTFRAFVIKFLLWFKHFFNFIGICAVFAIYDQRRCDFQRRPSPFFPL